MIEQDSLNMFNCITVRILFRFRQAAFFWQLEEEKNMRLVFQGDYRVYAITVPYHNGGVNYFILEEPEGFTLIDAGLGTNESWEIFVRSLNEIGQSLEGLNRIMITHHHHDHIGMLHHILPLRDVPVLAHPQAIPRLRRDPEFLWRRANFFGDLYRQMGCGELGVQHAERLKQAIKANEHLKIHADITPVSQDTTSEIGHFEIVDVPGHAPDQIMFYDRKNKLLFSGDHLLPDISSNAIVEPDIAGNRLAALVMYRNSLEKCRDLQVELALPGHGKPFVHYGQLIQNRLSYIEGKANKIEALIEQKSNTAFELAKEYYPNEYIRQFPLVMSSVIGTLDYLESGGRAEKTCVDGIWRYTKAKK